MKMLVSVAIITYNHEEFITQAIEGALMQVTTFDYEVIIGEDFSTDKTRHICQKYCSLFPEKVRLLSHEKNLGMQGNWQETLLSCKGKYIATCEGDDYWTDPFKLQKQVEILELNSNISICFHNVKILDNGELKDDFIFKSRNLPQVTTINDIARGNYIQTPSCVFRNLKDKAIGPNFPNSPILDYYLHVINAQYGDIYHMDETMAVYRKHPESNWSSKSYAFQLVNGTIARRSILLDLNDSNSEAFKIIFFDYLNKLNVIMCSNFDTTEKSKAISSAKELYKPVTSLLLESLARIETFERDENSIKSMIFKTIKLIIRKFF